MIVTTTPTVEGYRITGYYGIVFGEVITGINFLKDFGAGIRNLVGGRSAGHEIYRYERLRGLTSPFDTCFTLIASSVSAFRRS